MLDRFIRTVAAISRAFGVLAAAMLAASVGVIAHMVFQRYVLGESTIWQTPFATYMMMAATFLGSPYVLLLRGHVNVDLVPIYLRGRARFTAALIAYVLSLGFCLVVMYCAGRFWIEAFAGNWQSSDVWRVPLWPVYSSLPIGMALIALQYVADILALVTGREPPFGMAPEHGQP